jgi:hypothetical protein
MLCQDKAGSGLSPDVRWWTGYETSRAFAGVVVYCGAEVVSPRMAAIKRRVSSVVSSMRRPFWAMAIPPVGLWWTMVLTRPWSEMFKVIAYSVVGGFLAEAPSPSART